MHPDLGGNPQNRTEENTFVKQSQMHPDLGGNPQNRTEVNTFCQTLTDIDVVEQTGCGLILISGNQDVSPDNVSEKLGDVFLSS